jgi:hypothetical protein
MRFFYFDFDRRCVFDNGTGRLAGTFEASKSTHTFRIAGIKFSSNTGPLEGSYRVDGDRLFVDGSSATQQVSFILRRDRWGPFRPANLYMPRRQETK